MKSLRNKVILSGIVLLFAFIATIGSTYAWFTVSSSTQIETMTLNVTAADNLLLRVKTGGAEETLPYLQDASNYTTYIEVADLIAAGYLQDDVNTPWRLQPSTVLQPLTARMSYLPSVLNRTYAAATPNDYNGQYIHLEFWLLSQSEDDKIIQLSDFAIDAIGIGNNTTEQEFVENAVRLAVWLDDTTHGGATPTGEGTMYLFGNDADYGFTFTSEMEGYDGTVPANNTAPDQTGFTVNTSTALSDLYTVKFNIPTLINVLIYIEGWDTQASNDIILATFQVAFGFKYKEV
jgi:hypothetical protein